MGGGWMQYRYIFDLSPLRAVADGAASGEGGSSGGDDAEEGAAVSFEGLQHAVAAHLRQLAARPTVVQRCKSGES
jgi:hypothetical protein